MSLPDLPKSFPRRDLAFSRRDLGATPAERPLLARRSADRVADRPAGFIALLVWAGLAGALLVAMWSQLRGSLVSQDDAMRLVEVRAFLHGGSWFDLTEPRLGFPPGYLSHWSRLIDAPLAGLILLFSSIGGPAFGEDAARAAWPVLLLLPVFLSVTAMAGAIGGRSAALRAPFFGAMCIGGLILFRPGFIHHHNAQMALAALFVASSFAAPRSRGAAIGTGVIGALALAVGLESLAILAIAALGYALRFAIDPEDGRNFGAFGLSAAVSSLAVFIFTIPMRFWAATQCDAYAVNMFVGVAAAGLGAYLTALLGARRTMARRLFGLIAAGALAAAAYALLDPSCLEGPFGHIDPDIWPLWLSHVAEMRSLPRFFTDEPGQALLSIAYPLAGLAALPILWRSDRKPESLILGAILIVAAIISAVHVRGLIYANWFAVPAIAAVSGVFKIAAPERSASDRPFRLRPLTLLLAGLLLIAGAYPFLPKGGGDGLSQADGGERADLACSRIIDYAGLAGLPPGLVLSHPDLGPYILATTGHHVLAAPYHRLQKELEFARRLRAGDPSSAEEKLRDAGIDYLVDCRGEADPVEDTPASLRTALMTGHAPTFLEPVLVDDMSPVVVWRLQHK
ncbi:MAG: hypothetical protein ACHQAY_10555 [Hyphomicrobiales bacterium]